MKNQYLISISQQFARTTRCSLLHVSAERLGHFMDVLVTGAYGVRLATEAAWVNGAMAGLGADEIKTAADLAVLSATVEEGPNGEQGLSNECSTCGHPAGMHKCCPSCGEAATGFGNVKRLFGHRRPAGGTAIPQTWCRHCRALKALNKK
jgi:hypothetical protein